MSNELQKFSLDDSGFCVQVKMIDGEPYFLGKQVAHELGYYNTADAIGRHVDEEDKLKSGITLAGQIRNVVFINESGLYSLILRSNLPDAKKFKRWVTSEVLPDIRKHGMHMTNESLEKMLSDPSNMISVLTAYKDEKDKRMAAEAELGEIKPLLETFLSAEDNILVRDLAKVVSKEGIMIGQNNLYKNLRLWGLIMMNGTLPTQYAMNNEWFVVEQKSYSKGEGQIGLSQTSKVTPRGQAYIIKRLKKGVMEQ